MTIPPQQHPTTVRYQALGFAVAMSLLLYLDRFAVATAATSFQREMGLNESQLGQVQSAFFWTYALCQIPAGWLADRFGARRMLAIYVAGWSLAMAGLGLAGGLATLLVFRGLLGIFQAGAYPTTAGFLKHWVPLTHRGVANASVTMFGRAGGLLSMAVTPLLMTAVGLLLGIATGQWRAVFLLYAALGVIWTLFFLRSFQDTPQQHPRCNDAERELIARGQPPVTVERPAFPLQALLRSRTMWAMCLINFFVNIGWIFLTTWMPYFLEIIHGIDRDRAGMLTALTGLAGMTGSLCGGLLTDRMVGRLGRRWGRRLPGSLSAGGAALVYLAVLGTSNVYALVALFAAVYFLVDLGLGAIWSVYQDIGGRHVASLLGVANMCGNFAAALFATVIGDLAKSGAWQTVFFLSSGSFVITLICWQAVDASRPLTTDPLTTEELTTEEQ